MPPSDDCQPVADAMRELSVASQALYLAHISAVKGGQLTDQDTKVALWAAVRDTAATLITLCDIPDVHLSDIMADLLSE